MARLHESPGQPHRPSTSLLQAMSFEKRVSFGLAAAAAIFAISYIYATSLLHVPEIVDPVGPTAFPYLVGVGLLVCAGGLFVEALYDKGEAEASSGHQDGSAVGRRFIGAGVMAWTLVYFLVFDPIGFIASTALFLFGLTSVFHRGNWIVNAVVSIAFPVASYLLFTRYFEVMLPAGDIFASVF
ncbi:MAG: tripartite tricarboxylate transporter TctB family protein [Phyllobacterium sp.]